MSRPIVLVFLLVILIFTFQFEWRQQLVNEMEVNPSISQKQQHNLRREEIVQEKVSPYFIYVTIFLNEMKF